VTAAPGPQQPDEVEALAERLQQADPNGPFSALLDEPIEWDNVHTDRDYYRAFAAALLGAQPAADNPYRIPAQPVRDTEEGRR
jgi:hypothetical protein